MSSPSLSTIESRLESLFARLPSLPIDVKELIVKYGPYIVLVGGIVTLATTVSAFLQGLTSVSLAPMLPLNAYLSLLFNLVIGIALLLSFKPLRSQHIKGWRTLLSVNLLYIVFTLISFLLFPLFFVFGFAGPLISLYLLFQVKSYYR